MTQQTDGNDPAFATPDLYNKNGNTYWGSAGLSKREYFAAMALQGLIANGKVSIDHVADISVFYADSLIKALNKEK